MKTCDRVQQRLPEYWAGTIAVKDHREIDQHLETCAECKAEADQLGRLWNNLDLLPVEAPRQQVRTRFYEMLDAYRSGIEESAAAAASKRSWFSWVLPWQLAGAMAMLAVGFFAGRQFMATPEGGSAKKPDDITQIAQLRGEVNSMRQMMALSLLQQQSATDRMRGVNYAYRVDKSNSEVVAALLETVKTDPSVNVRLAAVDAFKNFASNSSARRGLLESVAQQDSPMVQIAIIELLVDLNDQTAVKGLVTLADNPKLQREVKDRARWAVSQLH
jgi:hypothetical protein